MSDLPARTPEPPYYAVIFTSIRTPGDNGYAAIGQEMVELVAKQPGFLGVESVRGSDGFGITVSYWRSEEDISAWKANARHQVAQRLGRDVFYQLFTTRVAKVERETRFHREEQRS